MRQLGTGASRTTTVPATRSPSLWRCEVASMATIPREYPQGIQSTVRKQLRSSESRRLKERPSQRSVRRPMARLPGV